MTPSRTADSMVTATVTKGEVMPEKNNNVNKSAMYQIITVIVAFLSLGGGGYAHLDSVSNEWSTRLATIEVKMDGMHDDIEKMDTELRNQQHGDRLTRIHLDLLMKIATLSDRLTRMEAKRNGHNRAGGK